MVKRSILVATAFVIAAPSYASNWVVSTNGQLVSIAYGSGSNYPQYAVLDKSSGYFRMNYGPISGWGTSVDLLPCYWSGGKLYQGYPVTSFTYVINSEGNLVCTYHATSNKYQVVGSVLCTPPANNDFEVCVNETLTGTMPIDNRPGETFKPVFLSSMHDSTSSWDASNFYWKLPTKGVFPTASGWIVPPSPAAMSTRFGLIGGTSTWKKNSPTVEIRPYGTWQVAGWLNADTNPNDDNVGYWAATTEALTKWAYVIEVRPLPH